MLAASAILTSCAPPPAVAPPPPALAARVLAPSFSDNEGEVHVTFADDAGSYEAALALAGSPRFLVDLRAAPASVRDWLDAALMMWSVGGGFSGEKNAQLRASPRGSFDVTLYVHEVTAAHALPKK